MAYIGNPVDTAFTSLLKQDLTGASGTSLTLSHAVANACLLYTSDAADD